MNSISIQFKALLICMKPPLLAYSKAKLKRKPR